MGKIRISHFITKNIPVTVFNSTTVQRNLSAKEKINESTTSNQINKGNKAAVKHIIKKDKPTKIINKTREIYKKEAIYAFKPVARRSNIITTEIIESVKEFREVGRAAEERKRKKIRITPAYCGVCKELQ